VYISDTYNHLVRKLTVLSGVLTSIAGTGVAGYSGDGTQATAAMIKYPDGINLDSNGNVYFGDRFGYNVIRKLTVSTGIISTVAGVAGTSGGYNGDNIQATSAQLNSPHDVVVDSNGNLYISDCYNNRIRKVDVSTGVVSTVVGSGTASSTGDGSAATSATINCPVFSRFDSAGNLYITEWDGAFVRKVVTVSTDIPTVAPSLSPHSISVISTVAGSGIYGYTGDGGVATSATLGAPEAVVVDSLGNIYIADTYNYCVRKVTISTGIITTVAGSGVGGFSGDGGAATSATLNVPTDMHLDAAGTHARTHSLTHK